MRSQLATVTAVRPSLPPERIRLLVVEEQMKAEVRSLTGKSFMLIATAVIFAMIILWYLGMRGQLI